MRTKVYSFKPKGKGYTLYATKKRPRSRSRVRTFSGPVSKGVSGALANFIVRGIFGIK